MQWFKKSFETLSETRLERTKASIFTVMIAACMMLSSSIYNVVSAEGYVNQLTWDDLISTQFSLELAPTNEEIEGQTIRLGGYVVPVEMDGELVSEFLLVPYAGACIHTPPPPANQIVYVIAKEPFAAGMHRQAVWTKGLMKIEEVVKSVGYYSAQSSYKLVDAEVEIYQ